MQVPDFNRFLDIIGFSGAANAIFKSKTIETSKLTIHAGFRLSCGWDDLSDADFETLRDSEVSIIRQFKVWSLTNHPDKGGNVEAFQWAQHIKENISRQMKLCEDKKSIDNKVRRKQAAEAERKNAAHVINRVLRRKMTCNRLVRIFSARSSLISNASTFIDSIFSSNLEAMEKTYTLVQKGIVSVHETSLAHFSSDMTAMHSTAESVIHILSYSVAMLFVKILNINREESNDAHSRLEQGIHGARFSNISSCRQFLFNNVAAVKEDVRALISKLRETEAEVSQWQERAANLDEELRNTKVLLSKSVEEQAQLRHILPVGVSQEQGTLAAAFQKVFSEITSRDAQLQFQIGKITAELHAVNKELDQQFFTLSKKFEDELMKSKESFLDSTRRQESIIQTLQQNVADAQKNLQQVTAESDTKLAEKLLEKATLSTQIEELKRSHALLQAELKSNNEASSMKNAKESLAPPTSEDKSSQSAAKPSTKTELPVIGETSKPQSCVSDQDLDGSSTAVPEIIWIVSSPTQLDSGAARLEIGSPPSQLDSGVVTLEITILTAKVTAIAIFLDLQGSLGATAQDVGEHLKGIMPGFKADQGCEILEAHPSVFRNMSGRWCFSGHDHLLQIGSGVLSRRPEACDHPAKRPRYDAAMGSARGEADEPHDLTTWSTDCLTAGQKTAPKMASKLGSVKDSDPPYGRDGELYAIFAVAAVFLNQQRTCGAAEESIAAHFQKIAPKSDLMQVDHLLSLRANIFHRIGRRWFYNGHAFLAQHGGSGHLGSNSSSQAVPGPETRQ